MSRAQHAGDQPTLRQRRNQELEAARDAFSRTEDVLYQVDCIYRKFKENDDYFGKLSFFDTAVLCQEGNAPLELYVEVDARTTIAMDRPPNLRVDIVKLLAQLPTHMLAIVLCLEPPSARLLEPQDVCPLEISCATWTQHIHRCSELANLITAFFCGGPEHKNSKIAIWDWPAIQARVLGLQQSEQSASPTLTAMIDVTNAILCKILGVQRSSFSAAFLGSPSDQGVQSVLMRMHTIVNLLNSVDRLAFLQAVTRAGATTVALQPDAVQYVSRNLFFKQPHVPELFARLAKYLALSLRLVRERVLSTLGPHVQELSDVRQYHEGRGNTRLLAYELAMAHEMVERWLQSSVIASIITATPHGDARKAPPTVDSVPLFVEGLVEAFLSLAHAGMALLSYDPDERGRRIQCIALQDQHTTSRAARPRPCTLEVPSSVLLGDVELLAARGYLIFSVVANHLDVQLNSKHPWGSTWSDRVGSWYLQFMSCAYYTLNTAHQVMIRRFPSGAAAAPSPIQPLQPREGQLSINVMRAASTLMRVHSCGLCTLPTFPPLPFPQLQPVVTYINVAIRTLLFTPQDAMKSSWAAGATGQAMFKEAEAVLIAPLANFTSEVDGSNLLSLQGVNLTVPVEGEWKAATKNTNIAKVRKLAAMQSLLQAREMNLCLWEIIMHVIKASFCDTSGSYSDLAEAFETSELADFVKRGTKKALGKNEFEAVWTVMPVRILGNLQAISKCAAKTGEWIGHEPNIAAESSVVSEVLTVYFNRLKEVLLAEVSQGPVAHG